MDSTSSEHSSAPESGAGQWTGDFDPLSDADERRVLFATIDSFKQYRKNAYYNVTHRRRQNFYALPTRHWQLLAEPPFRYLETLDRMDTATESNAVIAEAIFECGLEAFGLARDPIEGTVHDWRQRSRPGDVSKAHSTIRQFYRDWTKEGKGERDVVYGPILDDLEEIFGNQDKSTIRVLVPGAGLGRLVFDLCLNGFSAEGNEISYHQLLGSSWVLNSTAPDVTYDLYPFATQFTNNINRSFQFRCCKVPDIHPGKTLNEAMQNGQNVGSMNMSAADFLVQYNSPSQRGSFHAVATAFFIDTAPNFIRYIEAVHNCLVTGGIWTNVGPLLWHFDDRAPHEESESHGTSTPKDLDGIAEPGSFELTNDEVLLVVEKFGFRIVKQELLDKPVGYIQDPESMLQNLYRIAHWVAVKT